MVGTIRRVLIVVLGSLILVTPVFSREGMSSFPDSKLIQETPESPLLIIENKGQFHPEALFLLYGQSTRVWLTKDSLWIIQMEQQPPLFSPGIPDRGKRRTSLIPQDAVAIRISFSGANLSPGIESAIRQDTHVSYFTGNDPAHWYADVPVWGSVRYRELYPGIDLVFDRPAAEQPGATLPWRLEAQPGTDLYQVRLQVEGAETVSYDGTSLLLGTSIGQITLPALSVSSPDGSQFDLPANVSATSPDLIQAGVYQVAAPIMNTRSPTELQQPELPQVTDLVFSTYLGGSNWERGESVAVDSNGSAYVVGTTPSNDFPTTPGAFDNQLSQLDAFIAKFPPDGSNLVYATFLGGSGADQGYGIALASGNAYLVGETLSANFPTTSGAYDSSCGSDGACNSGGQGPYTDAFYAKLNNSGTALLYATYLGGRYDDYGYSLAVENDNVYLSGMTDSNDFPGGGYDNAGDVFAVKFNPSGGLAYSKLVGGGDIEAGFSIAVVSGIAYITGETSSPDFPAPNHAGGRDIFVLKLNPDGTVNASKLVGGGNDDVGNAISVASSGNIYVAGRSNSPNLPVTEGSYNGNGDAFVLKLNSALTPQYLAYVGGASYEEAISLSLDAQESIYLAGSTLSSNFPVTGGAFQTTPGGSIDAFIALIELPSTFPGHITYASYIGGSNQDWAMGSSIDPQRFSYITGYSYSNNFPTTSGAYDRVLNGSQDAFLTKLAAGPIPAIGIEKFTNGQDADTPPGVYLPVSNAVNWTYVVTNIGKLTLSAVSVSDDKGVTVSCPKNSLAVGESMTCTASGLANLGQYINIGSVTAVSASGPVFDSDPSHYFGANPGILLIKKINDQDANTSPGIFLLPGDAITWSYTVTNTGNVPLADVMITDDNGTPSNPDDDYIVCGPIALPTNANQTCTTSGTAVAGSYANVGTVTGTPPGDLPDVTDTDPSHYLGVSPGLSLVKKTQGIDATGLPGPYVLVGDAVQWTYEVLNTGNVDLTNVSISDDNGTPQNPNDDDLVCIINTLPAGATDSCLFSGFAAKGQYQNTATATAIPPIGATLTATDTSYYFGVELNTILVKSTNNEDADLPTGPYILIGDPVTWTYEVTNNGNTTLTNVQVIDDQGVSISCPKDTLESGESMLCTASGTATEGQYANLGTVTAQPPGGLSSLTISDPSHYFGVRPGIALLKKTNGQNANTAPGPYILATSSLTWTYVVTNTGNVPLTGVSIEDDNGTPLSELDDFTVCSVANLAPQTSHTCTRNSTAVVGQYENNATVSGTPPVGSIVSASDVDHYFGADPRVSLAKKTNDQQVGVPPGPVLLIGQPVTWTYEVSNSGNVDLTNLVIKDDNGTSEDTNDDFTCNIASLVQGDTQTCTRSGTVQAGQYHNIATVTAQSPVGPAVTASDQSYYYGAQATLTLEKKTNGQDADSPPGPYILTGSAVSWVYSVANTGEVTLTNLKVKDDMGIPASPGEEICTITNLAPGASSTCSRNGFAVAGQYSNTGTITGFYGDIPITATDLSHYFGAGPSIALMKSTNDQDANNAPGPYIRIGDPVNWKYQVQNTGNVALSAITVTDNKGVSVSCPHSILEPSTTMTCTANGTAVAGQYTNLGTARGTPPGGLSAVTAIDSSNYFGANPSLVLIKKTNGQDVSNAPGPYILVGNPVTWTYLVTNNGNVVLSSVTVTDSQGVDVSCPRSSLNPTESMTCTASGTASAGQYSNTGQASGAPPGNLSIVSASDTSYYFGADPRVDFIKRTNGQDANSSPGPSILVGDPVNWTYTVSNTGNVSLSSIEVSDNRGVAVACQNTSLLPQASMTCTAIGTAITGQYTNLGTVTGIPPGGLPEITDSDPSNYFGVNPSINLVKKTNGQDANNSPGPTLLIGSSVNWTYEVTNNGNVDLNNIAVSDNKIGAINCPKTSLSPNETMSCQTSGTAQAGQYTNIGTASGTPSFGPLVQDSDPSNYFGAPPGIRVVKYTNEEDANDPPGPYLLIGEAVSWKYEVTNTGGVPLLNVLVTDNRGVSITCPKTTLASSEMMICTASGTATAGQYSNTANASGTPEGSSTPVTSSDISHYFGIQPGISLEKKTNNQAAYSGTGPYIRVVQNVTWSYEVYNSGNVALSNITILDNHGTPDTGDDFTPCIPFSLDAGATKICTYTEKAKAGQYINTATLTATPPVGPSVSDEDSSRYFGADPIISLVKKTNGQIVHTTPGPYLLVGSTVNWTYEVSVDGNVPLSSIQVADDQGMTVACPVTTLNPGQSTICTASGVVETGQYTNNAVAQGTPPGGLSPVTSSDFSHYFGANPDLTLEKQTNNQDAADTPGPYILVSSPVNWSYRVTNSGNVLLNNLSITDNPSAEITCPKTSLSPAEFMTCNAAGIATAGQFSNTATATGSPPAGLAPVTASDTSYYFGSNTSISLVKSTNGEDADTAPGPSIRIGFPVTWQYLITNTGNVTLDDITVTDNQGVQVNCPKSILIKDEIMTCTASSTAIAGQYTNIGTVTGTPPSGLPTVSTSDPSHYFGEDPKIHILKKTNGQDADVPPGPYIPVGSPVNWTYIVSNIGNVTLSDILVSDNQGVVVTCSQSNLNPNTSMTCTGSGTASPGQYVNEATVVGTPPTGPVVNDTDLSHYFGSQSLIKIVKKTNGQDANDLPGLYILTDDPITWTYELTNTGNVTLNNVRVKDDNGTPQNTQDDPTLCVIASLAPSAPYTCSRNGIAAAGPYVNIGTVTGTPPGGLPDTSANDPSRYFGISPSVVLAKQTNGLDANDPPGPYIPVGNLVTWTYQITNNGNVTLTDLVVKDDAGTPGNTNDDYTICTIASLTPAASTNCPSKQEAVVPGQYTNTATVTASAPVGPSISDNDSSHYFGTYLNITLVKSVNGEDANSITGPYIRFGNPVTFSYVVTNGSNIPLSIVKINDDMGTSADISDDKLVCTIPTLSAGATQTCTYNATAILGQYTNTATASGTPPGGLADTQDTDVANYFGAQPSITLIKKTNGEDANTPPGPNIMEGDPVSWIYEVTNNGNVSVSGLNVVDDKGLSVSCPSTSLIVNQQVVCTASGTAISGQYVNTATASAHPPGNMVSISDSDLSHYLGTKLEPALDIQKYTNDVNAEAAPGPLIQSGAAVTWRYHVANIGNTKLSNLEVRDDNGTPGSPADDVLVCQIANLNINATATCSLSGTAKPGQYTNIATVNGVAPNDEIVTDTDSSYYFGAAPAIQLVKKTNGSLTPEPPGPYIPIGNPVTWTYQVKNTGNVDLTGIQVVDDNGTPTNFSDDIDVCTISKLTPNATTNCSHNATAKTGQYSNIAYSYGSPSAGLNNVSDTDTGYYFGTKLAISLVKKTNNQDANSAPGPFILEGSPIDWSYLVTNGSNVALSGLIVMDDNGTPADTSDDTQVCTIASLPAGNSQTCFLSGQAKLGPYVNIGKVTGTPPGGLGSINATDPSHYFGVHLDITLVKKTNGIDASTPPGPKINHGSPITWSYQVNNHSNVAVSNIVIKDDNGTAGSSVDDYIVCTITSLAKDESQTCTSNGSAILGSYANLAIVTAFYNAVEISALDSSYYTGMQAEFKVFMPLVRR